MKLFSKKEIGNQYEQVAKRYLLDHGLTFIENNFCCKLGEIDLIMQHKQSIVFVEVKYRKHLSYGHAAEFVTKNKASKLIKAAHIWLKKNKLSPISTEFRFDVVAIHQHGNDINWIKNAITEG
ncbi:UPF0102 protein [Vibrio sp. MACH09]|uniref:YraN family protein n=1 Tax=unclassified Vibrio TaxID=2614977 RepID=UPI00149366B0|nr:MULTISPECIES: YraN family protein [unclassified Vibrio]NOI66123.1 YraN family protein [Vibrio sp. 99-8-1]GLO61878.1 UPF0102 protein [Vibrio sp. MACH09]